MSESQTPGIDFEKLAVTFESGSLVHVSAAALLVADEARSVHPGTSAWASFGDTGGVTRGRPRPQ